jgi:hypothetical protein
MGEWSFCDIPSSFFMPYDEVISEVTVNTCSLRDGSYSRVPKLTNRRKDALSGVKGK